MNSLSEIKTGPKNTKNHAKLIYQAEAIALFDEILFVKKDTLDTNFANILLTLSKLSEIQLIWLESKNYTLNISLYQNINISSIDLSECDVTMEIKLLIHNIEAYYLERQNVDLILYNSKSNNSFVFEGVFKSEIVTPLLTGVSMSCEDEQFHLLDVPNSINLPTLINQYKQMSPAIYDSDKAFYPKLGLLEILKGMESIQDVVIIIESILWPDINNRTKIYQALEWIYSNSSKENSKYLMAYLKKYPDVLYESVQKNYSIDSILHLAVKDKKYKVIQAFFEELKEFPNAIKLILLQTNQEGKKSLINKCEKVCWRRHRSRADIQKEQKRRHIFTFGGL